MTALRRIAGLAASVVVLTVPLAAAADTSTLSVSMSVPSDCTITTSGSVTLAFGAIDLIRNAHAAAPTALVGVECNTGTVGHLAADKTGTAPADLTASGYTHGFAQNAAVTYTVKAS